VEESADGTICRRNWVHDRPSVGAGRRCQDRAEVPQSVLSPGQRVEIRLPGILDFSDGMPSAATVDKLHDHVDLDVMTTFAANSDPLSERMY